MSREVVVGNTVYRVVLVHHDCTVTYVGPYASRSSARGQATNNDRENWRGEHYYANVYVEEMTGEWVRV